MTNLRVWWCVLLLVVACASIGACQASAFSTETPETWQTDEVGAPSENVLWTCAGMALQKQGFPVGTGFDSATMVMTSGWKVSLAPFRGQGWREQAHIKFENVAPQRWKMQVRVARELNMDVKHPMELSSADWKADADDVQVANVIVQRIRSFLSTPLEVQPPPKKHK